MQDGSAAPQHKWAFALVHGIGTTKPTDLIREVRAALNGLPGNTTFDEPLEGHKVPAELRSPPIKPTRWRRANARARAEQAQDRRQYAQNGTFRGEPARFAAMEWSDISFYKEGLLNMIGGLLLTSFGVRYFAEAAGSHDRVLASLLHQVLRLIVLLIAFFAFPFTLVSLIYSTCGLLAENLLRGQSLVGWQPTFIVLASLAIAAAISWFGLIRALPLRDERPLAVPLFWFILGYAVLIALLFVAGHLDKQGEFQTRMPSPENAGFVSRWIREWLIWSGTFVNHQFWVSRVQTLDQIGLYFGVMHWLQLAVGLVMLMLVIIGLLIAALDDIVGRVVEGKTRGMVFAAVSVTSIWIVNLVIMWPENLVTASAMIRYSKEVKVADQQRDGCWREGWDKDERFRHCLRVSVYDANLRWFRTAHAYSDDVPTVNRRDVHAREPFNINAYYPLMWFEAAFIVFLALVGLSAVALISTRQLWCRRVGRSWRALGAQPPPAFNPAAPFEVEPPSTRPRRSNWPRLIVSDLYLTSVVILIAACALIMFAPALGIDKLLLQALAWIVGYQDTAGHEFRVPHEVSIPFAWVKIGVILFVALFVLGATYIRDMTKLGLDVVNHFTLGDGSFPVRQRIARRFDETINFLLRSSQQGARPHLVIIAHSQGTVITFDALRNGLWEDYKDSVASLTILTFGSPLTHIYQHYFGRNYTDLAKIDGVRALAGEQRFKWFNIYRVDDFVGTYIENSIKELPVNIPMAPGGHTEYWKNDVFQRLLAHPEFNARLEWTRKVPDARAALGSAAPPGGAIAPAKADHGSDPVSAIRSLTRAAGGQGGDTKR